MNSTKISQAAEVCLNGALHTNRPFSHVKIYLDGLRGNPDWTEAEITKVQIEVIRSLMQRPDGGAVGMQSSPSGAGC